MTTKALNNKNMSAMFFVLQQSHSTTIRGEPTNYIITHARSAMSNKMGSVFLCVTFVHANLRTHILNLLPYTLPVS